MRRRRREESITLHSRSAALAGDTRPSGNHPAGRGVPPAGIEPLPRYANACPSKGGLGSTSMLCSRPSAAPGPAAPAFLLRSVWIFNVMGVFTAHVGERRETARFRRRAPKRCACPGEEGGTPGVKRAGGRNPSILRSGRPQLKWLWRIWVRVRRAGDSWRVEGGTEVCRKEVPWQEKLGG